jgi:hypothetical protein
VVEEEVEVEVEAAEGDRMAEGLGSATGVYQLGNGDEARDFRKGPAGEDTDGVEGGDIENIENIFGFDRKDIIDYQKKKKKSKA